MNLLFAGLLFIVTVAVVVFPLFFARLQRHEIPRPEHDTSEADALLSALSELEDDYQLGRLTKPEYQQQKIRLQRQYLKVKQSSAE
jgi:cytochrome c-type biogenesis protein CcmI